MMCVVDQGGDSVTLNLECILIIALLDRRGVNYSSLSQPSWTVCLCSWKGDREKEKT